tara:strand:- start:414 stop:1634 length:1221 start_codon:yes stop_codon:yes gene_type:complete
MKILYNFDEISKILVISFTIQEDDTVIYIPSEHSEIHFSTHECSFILPKSFERKHLHNDIIALCSILLVYPFIGSKIMFEFPISEKFANVLNSSGKRILYRKQEQILPRVLEKGCEGINFDATVESIAISKLSDDNAIHVFLDSMTEKNKDFEYMMLDLSYIKGKRVIALKNTIHNMFTELYKSKPINTHRICFDLANYVPLLLLSDFYNIKYINFNCYIRDIEQLEMNYKKVNYYRTKRWKLYNYQNTYKNINSFTYWKGLFDGVNIEIRIPLGGITRVGIYKIIRNDDLYNHLPVCPNGYINSKCKNCKNCLVHEWMKWYYDNIPLEFDMDKLKNCKILYAYTLSFYKDSEHLNKLFLKIESKYPDIQNKMKTLQKYRDQSIIGNNNIFNKFVNFGIHKFSSFV